MDLTALVSISALALTLVEAPVPARLPIINDDYPTARAEAIRSGLPMFVDVWAPW